MTDKPELTAEEKARAEIKKFIDEFNGLHEKGLREYEQENRERIRTAPFEVAVKFDEKWRKVTGDFWFKGIKSEPPKVDGITASVNPKDNGYEGYYWVLFATRRDTRESIDVELMVNGEVLVAQRNVETILPGKFLEAADNAYHHIFVQEPGKDLKTVARVSMYPYTVLRKGTKEEFETARKSGTKKMKDDIRRAEIIAER